MRVLRENEKDYFLTAFELIEAADIVVVVTGFHDFQYFLSFYVESKAKGNILLVTHSDSDSLIEFLKVIGFIDNVLILPQISFTFPYWKKRRGLWFDVKNFLFSLIKFLQLGFFHRIWHPGFEGKTVKFFAYINNPQFLCFRSLFRNENNLVETFKVPFNINIGVIPDSDLKFSQKLIGLTLSAICGARLSWYQTEFYRVFGAPNFEVVDPPNPIPWKMLKQKLEINFEIQSKNSILLLDGPLSLLGKIDINTSLDRISKFLKREFPGFKIYVKPHYNSYCDDSHRYEVLGDIEFLPPFFPVELLLGEFEIVCLYASSAASHTVDEQVCVSLLPLVVFEDLESEDKCYRMLAESAGDRLASIQFPSRLTEILQ